MTALKLLFMPLAFALPVDAQDGVRLAKRLEAAPSCVEFLPARKDVAGRSPAPLIHVTH